MNLYARFEAVFRRVPDRAVFLPAAQDPRHDAPQDGAWSYADLLARTQAAAAALVELGVAPGDRVLVQVAKTPQSVALYLACLKIGAIYVPLNTAYTPPEVAYFVGDAEPALFVADPAFEAEAGLNVRVETLDAEGRGSLASLAAQAGATLKPATVARADDDIAAIVYTSGTTGRAKGAMLSHANLASNAATLCDSWGWRDDDVLLHALPVFHVHGLFVALHCALLTGTSMIFLANFDAATVLRELPRATVLMGVPTFYTRLLAEPDFGAEACRAMRLFISGSAPLTEQTFAAFEARTGYRILERYGMSETLMNTSNPLLGERVAGSVGHSLPGVSTRVADDNGVVLPSGAVGGIEVRGPNVFQGYWRMPEKTAAEFRGDGFFITGDMGTLDDGGRLRIVGRAKDLVISGGYNVYPKEVESLLDELPGVAESAVIGVPHADFGEAVVAVLATDGATVNRTQVDAFLRGRLARYKQPKEVVCVEQLPKNAMGKVQKSALRESYAGLFVEAGAASGGDTPESE